jgi:hypothetical protein
MSTKWFTRFAVALIAIAPIASVIVVEGGPTAAVSVTTSNPDVLTYDLQTVGLNANHGFLTDQNLFIGDNGGGLTWGGYAPCRLTSVAVTLSNGVHESFGPTSTGTIAPLGIGVNSVVSTGVNCTNTEGAIGLAALPSGTGYYIGQNNTGWLAYGNVSMPSNPVIPIDNTVPYHVVALAEDPAFTNSDGFMEVNEQGSVYAFGAAPFLGSITTPLNAPIVGIAYTPDGNGYWMVASDGGVFTFGDAKFYGSMGGTRLNQPIVGMAADNATGGYWLVAADGGIFSFNAPFHGSTGNLKLNKPIVGMEAAPDGSGYRFVASDGGIFSFNLPFEGSLGGNPPSSPVVGMAASGDNGYWLVEHNNAVQAFGSAPTLTEKTSPF